jgi:hypothetical protein
MRITGQEAGNERCTRWVVLLASAITEIVDGWHMATSVGGSHLRCC